MTAWKLVPCEATEEMRQDIVDHLRSQLHHQTGVSYEEHAHRMWRKALAAAPASPVTEGAIKWEIEKKLSLKVRLHGPGDTFEITGIDEAARAVMALFEGGGEA